MTVKIGTYRDVIHFGNIIKVSDGMGGCSQTFEGVCTVRGRAITSASEVNIGDDKCNVYNYTFECRFVEGIYPNMVMKLNSDNRIWTIKNVIDPSGKRERLKFEAQTEVPND